jgi:hypothetical protein
VAVPVTLNIMGFMKKLPWLLLVFGGGGLLILIPMMLGGFDAILHFSVAFVSTDLFL